jgi:hypothetical protein
MDTSTTPGELQLFPMASARGPLTEAAPGAIHVSHEKAAQGTRRGVHLPGDRQAGEVSR